MPLVNPTLPNDGESADAGDISIPFLALLAVFNGHIGADNIEPGTIPAALGVGSITTTMLAALAVTGAKIAAGAITPDKVAGPTVVATSTSGTLTPVLTTRMYIATALTENFTIATPTGTPTDGQSLTLRLKDNGTARTITWGAIYRAIGVTLPGSTVAGKTYYVSMAYNSAATKWDVLSVAREA
jgi:hypothetical protein